MNIEIKKEYLEYLEKAEEITRSDYDRKGSYISLENLLLMIRDLEYEIDVLEEKLKNTEEYYHDNYTQVSPYKMYGINESEFH